MRQTAAMVDVEMQRILDAVRTHIELNPEDDVTIIGGAASYLWVKEHLGTEIDIHDVDIHVSTPREATDVVESFLRLLPSYKVEGGSVSSITTIIGDGLSIDIF